MENRLCYQCKQYIRHDDNFGYCVRYNNQAKFDDNCKNIIASMVEE